MIPTFDWYVTLPLDEDEARDYRDTSERVPIRVTAPTAEIAVAQVVAAQGLHPRTQLPIRIAPSVVSWFLVDRACGGVEEGGWFYDCGEPIEASDWLFLQYRGIALDDLSPRIFRTRDDAYLYVNAMQPTVERANKGRRHISSVLSEGEYRVIVQDGLTPHLWPATKPTYC